jgi:hypothetical protein
MSNNFNSKYGDHEKYETWIDINFYLPIANQLVDPLYYMGFTPNMITITSTVFTFLSIYFLHINKKTHAVLSYIFGYILDCVDGMMARKYSMGTDFGMVLDSTSDIISNLLLFGYLICFRTFNIKNIFLFSCVMFLLHMCSLSPIDGFTSYKTHGTDNFYEIKKKQLEGKGCGIEYILNQFYLLYVKSNYQKYRKNFKTYNEEKIQSRLKEIKNFGPGTINLFIALLLLVS